MRVYASVLACDFSCLRDELEKVKTCDGIHLDIMDGHFVPNISFGAVVVEAVRNNTDLPVEVHLMVDNPLDYVETFAELGCDSVTFHVESNSDTLKTIEKIKSFDLKVVAALKPASAVEMVLKYANILDGVLIMTVEPGFCGQKFIPEQMEKVEELRKSGFGKMIQIDGGVNLKTVKIAEKFSVDCCVAGSAIFDSNECEKVINLLKNPAVTESD